MSVCPRWDPWLILGMAVYVTIDMPGCAHAYLRNHLRDPCKLHAVPYIIAHKFGCNSKSIFAPLPIIDSPWAAGCPLCRVVHVLKLTARSTGGRIPVTSLQLNLSSRSAFALPYHCERPGESENMNNENSRREVTRTVGTRTRTEASQASSDLHGPQIDITIDVALTRNLSGNPVDCHLLHRKRHRPELIVAEAFRRQRAAHRDAEGLKG
ncbi:hypothetical protein AB1N83_004838 [Pleurotus pulmonarius]